MREYIVKVIRFELLGNLSEGTDMNALYTIGREDLLMSHEGDRKRLEKVAKDHFAGRYLARTENRSLPMTRRKVEISWQDRTSDDHHTWSVNYMGTQVGELQIFS